jgi:hypothetical protein
MWREKERERDGQRVLRKDWFVHDQATTLIKFGHVACWEVAIRNIFAGPKI